MTPLFRIAFLLAALAALPVRAEDDPSAPTAADRAAIAGCLAAADAAGHGPDGCIGAVSEPCLAEPGNDSNVMMGACLDKEASIWDGRLNADYDRLMARLDDRRRRALRAMQRAWIALRNQTCEMEASFWEGGTGAGPASIACYMRETGHRAIVLRGYAAYLEQ